jgi:N-methylhydantoinase A
MTDVQTQANLALFIGETYCEIEVQSLDNKSLFYKDFFLPQSSLKNSLAAAIAEFKKLNYKINNIYVVCRYLERLKTFRLGGSVIQVTHAGLENNYTLENTNRFSLAAASLIISIADKIKVKELKACLESGFERTKKINPEANKVVINLDPEKTSQKTIDTISAFFSEKNFKIFSNTTPYDLKSIRQVLLSAGTQGTKEELTKEIQEAFADSKVYFWINENFTTEPKNHDLYFSADDFLGHRYFNSSKNAAIDKIVHLDIENWMVLQKNKEMHWDSPWGKLDRPHFTNAKLSLHPLTEILIDENALLQFSKNPASSEPGPMTAGRGVKSLILDLFYSDLKKKGLLSQIFPALQNQNTENKISSQFKVLENSQKTETKNLSQADIKNFITELIDFDIRRLGCDQKNSVQTGNMSFVITDNATFRWTKEIFKQVLL